VGGVGGGFVGLGGGCAVPDDFCNVNLVRRSEFGGVSLITSGAASGVGGDIFAADAVGGSTGIVECSAGADVVAGFCLVDFEEETNVVFGVVGVVVGGEAVDVEAVGNPDGVNWNGHLAGKVKEPFIFSGGSRKINLFLFAANIIKLILLPSISPENIYNFLKSTLMWIFR
jgi:hypothetical protein